jgi:SprT protein
MAASSKQPWDALASYLPNGAFTPVLAFLIQHKVKLTITRQRKTILGDYRHPAWGKTHQISINGNLNCYEFLITLLHELAHLFVFEQFGTKAEAHGKAWKTIYAQLLIQFIELGVFPSDVEVALQATLVNPAATANGEIALLQVLRKYSSQDALPGFVSIGTIAVGSYFVTEKNRFFLLIKKRRTRYECKEVATNLVYLFSGISMVKPVTL